MYKEKNNQEKKVAWLKTRKSNNSNKPVVYQELLDCLKLRRQKPVPVINSIGMRLAMDQLNLWI